MVQTEKVWEGAEELGLPRLVVLNRLDRERASLARSLDALREVCNRTIIPIQLPIGEEKSFKGIVDLVAKKAFLFETDGSGKFSEGEIPANMTGAVDEAREALIEMVAEVDEKLMEKFFEAGTLTDEELVAGLRSATVAAKIFPLVCTSAVLNIGIPQLLDATLACLPSPADRPFKGRDKAGAEVARAADEKAAASAFVWKTIADPFAGRITMFRVVSGTFKADSTVQNKTKDVPERLGHLVLLQGKTQTTVPELKAGDLGSVAKLKDTLTNDTIGDKSDQTMFPAIKFPEPVLSYAIEPKTRGDEDKISTSMHRLEEEDPSIRYSRDPQTKELLLSGQGQLHIEVTVAKLKRRFGVDVLLKPPRIPYRETIKGSTEAHGRHKKQTGGHGQFGDCKIRVEPLARGSDFEFVDDIFGGSIPRQFVPAVEKGIQDARTRGYLAGFPMVDFRVTVFDGSYHDVDSNELSFKLAGSLAFKDAMTRARPTILEPIMNVEVYAPSDFAGDLMGDLNSRRGRIGGMDTRGITTIIKAQVPMAEMLTYEQHLTSATGGRGSYHMEYSHYDEVPAHLQTKIIAAAKAERAGVEVEEV
jgi:elongation factor G